MIYQNFLQKRRADALAATLRATPDNEVSDMLCAALSACTGLPSDVLDDLANRVGRLAHARARGES